VANCPTCPPADLLLFFPTPLVILRVHAGIVRLLDFLLVSLFRFKLLDASRRRKSRRSTGICKRVSSVGRSVSLHGVPTTPTQNRTDGLFNNARYIDNLSAFRTTAECRPPATEASEVGGSDEISRPPLHRAVACKS